MRFIIRATKLNQYGNKVELIETREAINAWELSETLRIEGWTKSHIRQINEERLKYSKARMQAYSKRNKQ